MLGNGRIYDEYPYGFEAKRDLYGKVMRGENVDSKKDE
jgi:hypothetical protein